MDTKSQYYRNVPRKHFRKQPYPMRAPDSSGDGYVYRINIYEIYAKNPSLLLDSDFHDTDTLSTDTMDTDTPDTDTPDTDIPNIDSLNKLINDINQLSIDHRTLNHKNPRINWNKTKSMDISQEVGYNLLHIKEKILCSKIRLTPYAYLRAKYNILKAAQKFKVEGKVFRKSDAQRSGINFNVNKASVLWIFFNQLTWV